MEASADSQHTEIQHMRRFDILTNNRQTSVDVAELRELVNSLKDKQKTRPWANPVDSWIRSSKHYRIYLDNPSPKYLAKKKWANRDSSNPDSIMAKAIRIDRDKATPSDLRRKKKNYANDSIMNEMQLSGEVRRLMLTDEVQSYFKEIDIDSVDFIEPLVGIIDNKSGEKTIVYKFSNGEPLELYLKRDTEGFIKWKQIQKKLEEIFVSSGIIPEELGSHQFLVEKDGLGKKHAFLIDIEMYYRK